MQRVFFLIKSVLFSLLLLAFSHEVYSQVIVGKVFDSNGIPLEFVTVCVKKDSNIIKIVFTDNLGSYNIGLKNSSKINISFTYVGYEKAEIDLNLFGDTSLNTILNNNNTLNEVVIKSSSPIVERKIDRLVFYPSNLITTSGNNAFETVKKSPSVSASENGDFSIRGLSGAGVMINGRLLQLSNEQIVEYLKSIPSDEILKVEIITNPSSKYDAAGLSGLINIVLKKNKKIGLSGNSNFSYEQTTYAKYGINTDLNYWSEKLNIFGGISLKQGKYLLHENIDNIYNKNISPYYYTENGKRVREQLSNFGNFGIDYYINKKHLVGFRSEYSYISKNSTQKNDLYFQKNSDQSLDSLYKTSNLLTNYNHNLSTNFNYLYTIDTLGQSLSFDFDYSFFFQPELISTTLTEKHSSNFTYLNDVNFKNTSYQKIGIYSIKGDYSKPINSKTWLEIGSKYYSLNTNNHLSFFNEVSNEWVIEPLKSNSFNYYESNIALYLNINYQFNEKLSTQGGLRNENTFLRGYSNDSSVGLSPNYSKLFPSLFFQYNKNDNNQFTLSYAQRISRPDYSNLNPFRYYASPNNYTEGNPFLRPAFTKSFDLSYMFKQKYYFNAFAYFTNGQITQVPVLEPSTNSYKYASINLDRSYIYGINLYTPFSIRDWLKSSISITSGVNGVSSEINGNAYFKQNFNVLFALNNQIVFSERKKIFGEINFVYQPKGTTQGLFTLGRMMDLSCGLKKNFRNEKSSISLLFIDILNAAYITATVNKTDQYSYIYGNYDKRGIRVVFSYKLGKKTIDNTREKNSSIEDEKKRLKQ